LWEPIDDDQAPGWTDITVPLTIDNVATFGGMAFASVPIAGQFKKTWIPDTANWTDIDDTQTANWTEIVQ